MESSPFNFSVLIFQKIETINVTIDFLILSFNFSGNVE